MRAGVAVLVGAAVLAAGCSAAHKRGGEWAGMSSYDAGNAAHDIIDQETSSQSSPIYGKELVVAGVSKGADPQTHQAAWVVRMENFDHVRSPECIYLSGSYTPLQGTEVTYDLDACPGRGGA